VLVAGSSAARASDGAGEPGAAPPVTVASGEGVTSSSPPSPPLAALPAAPIADSRGVLAPLAGALTLVVPFVVGSALVARDDDTRLQNIGSTVMLAGFAAAPWVSHALAGRWGRGLAFGGAALAVSAATWFVMAARDPYDQQLGNRKRLPFGFLISTSFFVGAGGVTDSFIVGPEQRQP